MSTHEGENVMDFKDVLFYLWWCFTAATALLAIYIAALHASGAY